MKNIPRIFIDAKLAIGEKVELSREQYHYLVRVMRTDKFLAFNDGVEFEARIFTAIPNARFAGTSPGFAELVSVTSHKDPSNGFVFCFAPIKKIEDLISGVVQMGAAVLQPVITERTVVRNVNWDRMRKIVIENCEQSGRNSVPELRPPIPFPGLDKKDLVFGDERKVCPIQDFIESGACKKICPGSIQTPPVAFGDTRPGGPGQEYTPPAPSIRGRNMLVGPEGGFSNAEFDALDSGGAIGISLGPTILRAEVAAVALIQACLTGWGFNDRLAVK